MPIPDYTLVVGVDDKHLRQLVHTWPTWVRHKPSILAHRMIVFYDKQQVSAARVRAVVDHPKLTPIMWPPGPQQYERQGEGRRGDPQRYKMLAGFVHIPARHVWTKYWLKLDTDTIATGVNDWIEESWFDGEPEIVSQRWGFTKPADQMIALDHWASGVPGLRNRSSLGLVPEPGRNRLPHKRIISWCGFFRTDFTDLCAQFADVSVGPCKLPVPSQDGYMWYCAERLGRQVVRVNVKSRGWLHRSAGRNVERESRKALEA